MMTEGWQVPNLKQVCSCQGKYLIYVTGIVWSLELKSLFLLRCFKAVKMAKWQHRQGFCASYMELKKNLSFIVQAIHKIGVVIYFILQGLGCCCFSRGWEWLWAISDVYLGGLTNAEVSGSLTSSVQCGAGSRADPRLLPPCSHHSELSAPHPVSFSCSGTSSDAHCSEGH